MARTKRAQILMEPVEYKQLEDIARSEDCSVAELVREAVREKYGIGARDRKEVLKKLLSYSFPIEEDWPTLKKEIEGKHLEGLP